MAGGWASALGAAILQGSQGYQQTLALQRQMAQQGFENNRQVNADARAQQEHDQNMKLLLDRIAELPKQHAASDAQTLLQREGSAAFNMPAFVDANNIAGTPLQQLPGGGLGVTRARVNQIEQGSGPATPNIVQNPVDSQTAMARNMGVTPDTGVVIPKQFVAQDVATDRALQRDKVLTDFMAGQASGGAPNGAPTTGPTGAPEPPRYDPQEYRNYQMGKLSGLPTPEPVESAAHKLWMEQQTLTNKAAYKPPSAATERERLAYEKARIVIPQLRAALMEQVSDKSDPTGQKLGLLGSIGQKFNTEMTAGKYSLGLPIDAAASHAQQLAGALRVIGTAPYMNGSRSQQMFTEAADHINNRHFTPEAQIQRIDELEPLFAEFEKLSGVRLPQGGQPGAPTQANPAAPAQANPATSQPKAGPIARGGTVPYGVVQQRAQVLGMTPDAVVAQLKANGVTVVR